MCPGHDIKTILRRADETAISGFFQGTVSRAIVGSFNLTLAKLIGSSELSVGMKLATGTSVFPMSLS